MRTEMCRSSEAKRMEGTSGGPLGGGGSAYTNARGSRGTTLSSMLRERVRDANTPGLPKGLPAGELEGGHDLAGATAAADDLGGVRRDVVGDLEHADGLRL